MKNNTLNYSAYVLYTNRDGKKVPILCNSKREANRRRRQLKRNKRKFLGVRSVTLVEA